MTPAHAHRRLLVFARNPLPGQVKTRLIPALGVQLATQIYRRLLQDTLRAATYCATNLRELWLDRLPATQETQQLAQEYGLSLHLQQGRDLGMRMYHALSEHPPGACASVLVGSDCAQLDAAYLNEAFEALERDDAVLGPAADGGYVLIGLCQPMQSLFNDMRWGTDQVLAQTRQRLRAAGLSWHELPVRHDIDHATDVERFPHLAAIVHRGERNDPIDKQRNRN